MKDLANLELTLSADLEASENRFVHVFNALIDGLTTIEEEANKIIMRTHTRRALNGAHNPSTVKPDNLESCFEILVPWKDTTLVGILEQRTLASHKAMTPSETSSQGV